MHNLGVDLYPGLLKTHTFKVKSMGSVYTRVRFIPEYIRYTFLESGWFNVWKFSLSFGAKGSINTLKEHLLYKWQF